MECSKVIILLLFASTTISFTSGNSTLPTSTQSTESGSTEASTPLSSTTTTIPSDPTVSTTTTTSTQTQTDKPTLATTTVVDPCSPNPCLNGGNCVAGKCECAGNYTGETCEIERCTGDENCLNGGKCNSTSGLCSCAEGYTGVKCESVTGCDPNPCENGGTCGSGGACSCPDGYSGDKCQTGPDNGNVATRGTVTGIKLVLFSLLPLLTTLAPFAA